jgi:hypothetical protein
MATDSVPGDADERKIRQTWIDCLRAAPARSGDATDPPRFLTAPQVRALAERIGTEVAQRWGLESPQVCAAVAMLLHHSHPVTVAILLAGHLTGPETAAARR